jgi:hypothetical protein
MKKEQFKKSLSFPGPPSGMDDHLLALWFDARGDWEGSHETIQDLTGLKAAWIHAYLHRKEGDLSNAAYWYQLAGRKMSTESLDEEWEEILSVLVDQ